MNNISRYILLFIIGTFCVQIYLTRLVERIEVKVDKLNEYHQVIKDSKDPLSIYDN